MRPKGSQKELETRRRRAVALRQQGWTYAAIGRHFGCAHSAVIAWTRAYEAGGDAGLNAKPVPGRPRKLTATQLRRLPVLLARGPMAHGFSTELWTGARVAELIFRQWKVRLHRTQVTRLLHDLGWSCQKPERRALERDEQAIERWKRTEWPRVKKTPGVSGRTWRSSTRAASS